MKAQDPSTGEWKYFIDKCLPFGASISCALFQSFSDALCHLMEFKTNAVGLITNYLDNFLFLALTLMRCNAMIHTFLELCKEIRVPIAFEKTEWGDELVIFLGILLDGRHLKLALPLDKKEHDIQLLKLMLSKKKATVKEIQSLCGYLNFLCKAIFPGRPFVRRMYSKYSSITRGTWLTPQRNQDFVIRDTDTNLTQFNSSKKTLKPYHHIRIDKEFKFDCQVWLDFLDNSNMETVVTRPMIDLLGPAKTSEEITFYSDASGSIGFGCILNTRWLHGTWNKKLLEDKKPSIEYLELFALAAGVITWADSLTNTRIVVFCDNISVVHILTQ